MTLSLQRISTTKLFGLASVAALSMSLVFAPYTSAATSSKTCKAGTVTVSSSVLYTPPTGSQLGSLVQQIKISIPSGQLDYWAYASNASYDTGIKRASGRSVTLGANFRDTSIMVYGGKANDGLPMCSVTYGFPK